MKAHRRTTSRRALVQISVWLGVGLLAQSLMVVAIGLRGTSAVAYGVVTDVFTANGERARASFGPFAPRFGVHAFNLRVSSPSGPITIRRSAINTELDGHSPFASQSPVIMIPTWAPHSFHTSEPGYIVYVAQGWPFRSVTCSVDPTGDAAGGIRFGSPGSKKLQVIGYRPIPLGLICNTLCYGLLGYGVVFVGLTARRNLRVHAGRCPDCGYDLAGTTGQPCPECGRGDPKPSDP